MENTTETFDVKSKLTTGSMGLDAATLKDVVKGSKGKPVAIALILAQVNEMKEQPNRLDPSKTDTKFLGQFEGTNLLTGEVSRSGAMYLPGAASDYLKGQGAGGGAVAFQLTVEEDKRANSSQGYKFGVKAIAEKAVNDPFAALRAALPKPGK